MYLGKNTENETFIFEDIVNNSKGEKILGVTVDNRLTFSSHIRELCKKLLRKHRLCQEYQTNLVILKRKLLFNAVVKSQFNNYLLVWMFFSRTLNNMINKVHEKTLRVTVGDDLSDFKSLHMQPS